MPDFRSIRAAQTPPPSLCSLSSSLPQPRLPTPLSTPPTTTQYFELVRAPLARALVHDAAYLPHGRTPLGTASRITTLIRTGAPPFHEAVALRPGEILVRREDQRR